MRPECWSAGHGGELTELPSTTPWRTGLSQRRAQNNEAPASPGRFASAKASHSTTASLDPTPPRTAPLDHAASTRFSHGACRVAEGARTPPAGKGRQGTRHPRAGTTSRDASGEPPLDQPHRPFRSPRRRGAKFDVIDPAAKSATRPRPSTSAQPVGFALPAIGIGEPSRVPLALLGEELAQAQDTEPAAARRAMAWSGVTLTARLAAGRQAAALGPGRAILEMATSGARAGSAGRRRRQGWAAPSASRAAVAIASAVSPARRSKLGTAPSSMKRSGSPTRTSGR